MFNLALNRSWKLRTSLMAVVLFVLISSSSFSCSATEAGPASTGGKPWKVYTEWPFSGAEAKRRQEETAKALGIPVEKTMDLGNGVTMELILIPAGRFIMGTPEPVEPDWVALADVIMKAQIILVVAASTVLAFVLLVLFRAWRLKRRPQMSLRFFLALILALSLCSWGGVGWHQGKAVRSAATARYKVVKARFNEARGDELPAHEVTFSKPFYMGKYEVTQEQYEQVMGSDPSKFKGRSLPVEKVPWNAAVGFCKQVGNGLRLPSEAEWEHACRTGTMTSYSSGDAKGDLDRVGWYRGNSGNKTHPVGAKSPNAFGLYDMHGNVLEWCEDDGHSSYQGAPTGGGAWMDSPRGGSRVCRGGAWHDDPWHCRSTCRIRGTPDIEFNFLGFRVSQDF